MTGNAMLEAKRTGSDAAVCPAARPNGRAYTIAADASLGEGDRLISTIEPDGTPRVQGIYDAETGNVFAYRAGADPRTAPEPPAPVVLIAGDLSGQTGQVTILQADGSYRRFSRWDRIEAGSPAQPDAILRTLPQCGCGGSLGMPKLFDSFAEMSAYFYCTFALDAELPAVQNQRRLPS